MRPVTEKLANILRRVTHHTSYDLECPSHPGGICTTDYNQLLNVEKLSEGRGTEYRGRDPRTEWRKLKLSDIVEPEPDLSWDKCECPMCHLGHYNPVAAKIGRKKFTAILDPAGLPNLEVQNTVENKKKKVGCTVYTKPGTRY